jgi:phosphoglycerol transferase MdoB-like AlkP superfamily enzyme
MKSVLGIILNALSEYYLLSERYRKRVSILGWATLGLFCFFVSIFLLKLWQLLGLPLEGGEFPPYGRIKLIFIIVALVVAMPLVMYISMFIINFVHGAVLYMGSKIIVLQWMDYTTKASYPSYWYE